VISFGAVRRLLTMATTSKTTKAKPKGNASTKKAPAKKGAPLSDDQLQKVAGGWDGGVGDSRPKGTKSGH
jgi:hypothetical protein